MHHFVSLEIFDQRVAGLHGMQSAIGRRRFQKIAEFHETMSAAA
jgi:hypothetical protein